MITNQTFTAGPAADAALIHAFALFAGAATPITTIIDHAPGKTTWTLTIPQRIGIRRHTITILNDPFTTN